MLDTAAQDSQSPGAQATQTSEQASENEIQDAINEENLEDDNEGEVSPDDDASSEIVVASGRDSEDHHPESLATPPAVMRQATQVTT